ncbi:MAG: hypothetical protein U9Q84_06615 [Thermodesulfobacteriota bacterium]|nr:hypothetical protein [Thermodesulfobacteriota bacterium]
MEHEEAGKHFELTEKLSLFEYCARMFISYFYKILITKNFSIGGNE